MRLSHYHVRTGLALILSAVCVATITAAAVGTGKTASARSLPMSASMPIAGSSALGVYTGPANTTGPATFAQATNSSVTIASDYLPANSGWATMVAGYDLNGWLLDPWKTSGYHLVLGVPMVPTNTSGTALTTLAQGASGANNSYFTTLAQTLVSENEGSATLRLGWEFDGNWYAWSVANSTDAANYAAYWRQIVTTMRAVPGANFTFNWNPDASAFAPSSAALTEAAYPGSAYVSQIGGDFYDISWDTSCGLLFNDTSTPTESNCVWNNDSLPALNAMAAFAAAKSVPVSFPEWGVAAGWGDGHGLGDDPTYVNLFANWIAAHNVAWTSYFNYGGDIITGGTFPNALAAFRTDFSTPVTPPTTSPTPPTTSPTPPPTTSPPPPTPNGPLAGYRLASSTGAVSCLGTDACYGSITKSLNRPIVGLVSTTDDKGYWLVASDGGVFSFGDAGFYGSMGGKHLNRPIVGMAATADGKGYWQVASDGGIFAFGDAGFYGSMGGKHLNRPVVGIAATSDGKGYWLVASDGGIFSFGDAAFYGSAGALVLNQPIVGMTSTSDGKGYWFVAADGGVFNYGDAGFYGAGSNQGTVGMSGTSDGKGYWVANSGAHVSALGDAATLGPVSTSLPVVAIAR